MRRIRIAWGILACIVALTVGSHIAVWRITQATCARLDALRASAQQADYTAARLQAEELTAYFSKHQHLLEFFIRRETVAAASVNLQGLRAYASEENAPDLYSEIDKAAEELRMLEHLFFSLF